MVAFGRFRRYDVQATSACVLSLVSVLPFLGAAALIYRNYHHELGQIVYGSKGMFLPAFAALMLMSIVPSTIGLLFGWSSAGQRRNPRPVRSWMGFFVGALVLTLDVILLIALLMLRLQRPA